MRGPTRGSRDGKVGCAKRSSGGKNSSSRLFVSVSIYASLPFCWNSLRLKKSTRNSGEGSQAVQGGGGKKRHRIDETRQVTNNNLGRGERDPPLFLPFVSKISRTMDAPPPPPPPLVRVRCRHRTCVSRGINGFRGRGTKGGMEGRKEEERGRKTGVDPSR